LSTPTLAATAAFVAILGGALGSFAGVVASRGWKASLGGRSHCDTCGRSLSWFELVPFISFVALRARCRTCGASFGWGPILWEAGGAAIALAVAVPVLVALGV
jgi:leader peptidase (prepilin peptidase)/N-methyltransferase